MLDRCDQGVQPDPECAGEHDAGPCPREVEQLRVEFRICTPSALVGPPKYSPTIAPIIESTAAILRPVNMYGREFGIRTRRKMAISPPA